MQEHLQGLNWPCGRRRGAADESAAVAGQLAEETADTELTEDTVRMYLREISRVALLTADDEVVLGARS